MSVRVNKSSFNIREKLSELERPIGVKGNELMRAETAQDARDLVSAGRKNILINGNFIVSQRGDYTSATAFSSNTYYLDRWKIKGGTPTGTIQDLTRKVKLAATATNSSGQMMVMQVIEDKTINLYGGKIVTLSALVKSNNPNCRVMYEFSGDGWMTANIDANHNTHSGNGQEERLYVTFKIPDNYASSNTSTELRVYVGFDSYNSVGGVQINNGDYFEASEVQLEVGKNATEFEHRSYSEELLLCQRYYYKLGGNVGSSSASYSSRTIVLPLHQSSNGQYFIAGTFPVDMRDSPTITPNFTSSDYVASTPSTVASNEWNLRDWYVANRSAGTINLAPERYGRTWTLSLGTVASDTASVFWAYGSNAAIEFNAEL